jgi:BlaI family penicillinase repressor
MSVKGIRDFVLKIDGRRDFPCNIYRCRYTWVGSIDERPRSDAVGAELALPDAELEVLACLWQKGEATARDVREAMAAYRPLTHSAVSTLLARLQEKGLVVRRKGPVGKAFLFRAVDRPKATHRRLIGDLVERVFGGDALAVVSSLFETRPPNAEELDRLEQLLGQLRSSAAAPESPAAKRGRTKGKRR